MDTDGETAYPLCFLEDLVVAAGSTVTTVFSHEDWLFSGC